MLGTYSYGASICYPPGLGLRSLGIDKKVIEHLFIYLFILDWALHGYIPHVLALESCTANFKIHILMIYYV